MIDRARNYLQVQENIANICSQASINKEDITLLAVSKYHDAKSVAEIAMLGHKHFAENYLKEAKEKKIELQQLLPKEIYESLLWHSIGHIQTNKAKEACNDYEFLHTIDSERLVLALNKVLLQKQRKQKILIEVNIANEEQKAGVLAADCPKLIESILNLENFDLQGFMSLPPFQRKKGENRKYFAQMYELKQKMENEFAIKLNHLSMGTSSDYEEAILEGATFVRIGTDIFGEREY